MSTPCGSQRTQSPITTTASVDLSPDHPSGHWLFPYQRFVKAPEVPNLMKVGRNELSGVEQYVHPCMKHKVRSPSFV